MSRKAKNLPEIISRQEAIARGLKRYFTGKPCPHGHLADRVISGRCVECRKLWDRRNSRKPHIRVRKLARERKYYADHRKTILEKQRVDRLNKPERHRARDRRHREKNHKKILENSRKRNIKMRGALAALKELGIQI